MRFTKFRAALALLAGLSSLAQADDLSDIFGGGGLKGKKLETAILKANEHPLGSDKNPVRVNMPYGQRAYLAKLKCSDGKTPAFQRGGSVGIGPFGSIVDVYDVDCGAAAPGNVAVFMDMYHANHEEKNAVPGFTMDAR